MSTHETQNPQQTPEPQAVLKKTRFFSVVWIIPLVALLSGLWLLVNDYREKGPTITLYVSNADGIEANKTTIKFLSVDVGQVTDIKINKDQSGVILKARLTANVADLLKKDTVFWLVKPRISQDGVSGLSTLVSGVYIEMFPGKSDEEAEEYTLADVPPLSNDTDGTRLRLVGQNDRLLNVGSPVMYEDFQVGQIERAQFNPDNKTVEYQIFVNSPNDILLGDNVQFWVKSGLDIQANSSGFKIDTGPLSSFITGSISFMEPKDLGKGTKVTKDSVFTIYPNQAALPDQPTPRSIYMVGFFEQSIGALNSGAEVKYKGLNIGRVVQAPYFAGNDRSNLLTNRLMPVLFRLEPALLEDEGKAQDKAAWNKNIQTAMSKGLVATLSSSNLLTGQLYIDLQDDLTTDPITKPTSVYDGNIVIGTRVSGMDNTMKQLNGLLVKLNKLDLNGTVNELNGSLRELKQTLKNVNQITSQDSVQKMPAEINQTLQALQHTLSGVSPNSPAYKDVQETLQNLNQTLQKVDPMLRTLNEQPNALIFNKKGHDPMPQGKGR